MSRWFPLTGFPFRGDVLYTLSQQRPSPRAPRTAIAASRAWPYLLEPRTLGSGSHLMLDLLRSAVSL